MTVHARPRAAASIQGLLALDLGPGPSLPTRPNLRLVTGEEPTLNSFATRFAQAVVEVISGDRSVYQLMRWTTDDVYEDMFRRTAALSRAAHPDPRRRRRLRSQVRSVHLSSPVPDVAEISIHVRHGERSRAIAARIERIEGRWRCSALEFG